VALVTCSSSWEKYSPVTTGDFEASHKQLSSLGSVVVAAGLLLMVVDGGKTSPEPAPAVAMVMVVHMPLPFPVRPQCQAQPLFSPAAQSKSASNVEGSRIRTAKVFIFLTKTPSLLFTPVQGLA